MVVPLIFGKIFKIFSGNIVYEDTIFTNTSWVFAALITGFALETDD